MRLIQPVVLALAGLLLLSPTARATDNVDAVSAPTLSQARLEQSPEQRAAASQADDALIAEPTKLLQAGNVDAALPLLDTAIAQLESRYAGSTRWYSAREPGETLFYMLSHAAELDAGKATGDARILPSDAWPLAWYLKAYALIEKDRIPEARAALEHALEFAPINAAYLLELVFVQQKEKDWVGMLETSTRAEEGAAYAAKADQPRLRARAWRGQGFALIELGRLDEAEAKFRQALEQDANDKLSRNELEYIRSQRTKQP